MSKKNHHRGSEQFTLFHLQPQHAGQTLGGVLRGLLTGNSWGQIQSWIRSRHVQINGNLCMDPARRVTEKDVIKLWREPLPKPVTAAQLVLPYVDEHLLVVEKPAGITSVWHRQERQMPDKRRQLQPTLEELLSDALTRIVGPPRGAGPSTNATRRAANARGPRPGHAVRWPIFPVHRLDRDTSGLMLFARTRIAEQKLVAMFRDHLVQRQYWAVAHGMVASQTIRSILVRDRGDGLRGSLSQSPQDVRASAELGEVDLNPTANKKAPLHEQAASDSEDGQIAITHVEFVEQIGDCSVVRCRLETGRTHQIRIHLSELGHPLCGEKSYIRRLDGPLPEDQSGAPRQVLHAERLAFTHPLTGERLQFKMALPADLKNWLTQFRQRHGGSK